LGPPARHAPVCWVAAESAPRDPDQFTSNALLGHHVCSIAACGHAAGSRRAGCHRLNMTQASASSGAPTSLVMTWASALPDISVSFAGSTAQGGAGHRLMAP